jgi:uncharacterized protein YgbK (DUF1537 family)
MSFMLISDDLSGAAGMASLLGRGIKVVPMHSIKNVSVYHDSIISIDLETRNSTGVGEKLDVLRGEFPDYKIITRIDTLLRGSTAQFIEYVSRFSDIALTDTIPDYGRYTYDGYTIYRGNRQNLNRVVPDNPRKKIFIFDSRNYDDLKIIAEQCMNRGLIPVDPGPLIKIYLEMLN